MGAPAVAAILRRREREVVDDFRAAGATSPANAQSYNAVGVGESIAVRRLRARAVLREGTPGTYYLDEQSWTALLGIRRRIAVTVLSVLAFVLLGVLLGTIKW
jgi:hypothetical protein